MAEFPLLHRAVAPVLAWTRETALPFWGSVGVDEQRGGFHERLDLTGQPVQNVPKRLMVQGRQLYVYSHAAMLGWHDDGKRLAGRCVEYLLSSFYQADGKPGWVFALAPDGSIANPTRDGYGHAFVLLGLAWYYRLTRDAQVLTVIDNTIGFLDKGLASPRKAAIATPSRRLTRSAARTRICISGGVPRMLRGDRAQRISRPRLADVQAVQDAVLPARDGNAVRIPDR